MCLCVICTPNCKYMYFIMILNIGMVCVCARERERERERVSEWERTLWPLYLLSLPALPHSFNILSMKFTWVIMYCSLLKQSETVQMNNKMSEIDSESSGQTGLKICRCTLIFFFVPLYLFISVILPYQYLSFLSVSLTSLVCILSFSLTLQSLIFFSFCLILSIHYFYIYFSFLDYNSLTQFHPPLSLSLSLSLSQILSLLSLFLSLSSDDFLSCLCPFLSLSLPIIFSVVSLFWWLSLFLSSLCHLSPLRLLPSFVHVLCFLYSTLYGEKNVRGKSQYIQQVFLKFIPCSLRVTSLFSICSLNMSHQNQTLTSLTKPWIYKTYWSYVIQIQYTP